VHVVRVLLEAGYDLYALDVRRTGRAKRYGEHSGWDPKLAHSTSDFGEYAEEVDQLVDFARRTTAGEADGELEQCVLYANSTGALVALTYLRHPAARHRALVSHLVLNGPFLDWDKSPVLEAVLRSPLLTGVYSRIGVSSKYQGALMAEGSGLSATNLRLWSRYWYPLSPSNPYACLRGLSEIHTTREWVDAVTRAQKAIRGASEPLRIPLFVIASIEDAWLSTEEGMSIVDAISDARCEVQVHDADHDVLLSADRAKVRECFGYMLNWLQSH
jgi:alpha-beta hydrolase superfamily lysophospholipase